jgi:hypothetical protein
MKVTPLDENGFPLYFTAPEASIFTTAGVMAFIASVDWRAAVLLLMTKNLEIAAIMPSHRVSWASRAEW